jgi:pimeloyl-ACP methyl ester carboxylesterase
VAWAHGTFGLGDQCAPSQEYFQGNGPSVPLAQVVVNDGGIFVASDYEGLGPPGDHPYMVSQASGRNVLDSIRAAAHFSAAGSSAAPPPPALVLGQSQGGAAALFAAELHASYAPELRVLGTVAVSAPSGLDKLDNQLSGGRYFGYVLMTVYGFRAAYPELTSEVQRLTTAGRTALDQIPTECADEILSDYAGKPESEYGAGPVLHSPAFSRLLKTNEPAQSKSDVPILLVHGEDDDTIPVQNNRDLLRRYCATGTTVAQMIYPGRGHVNVLSAALADIVAYLKGRLDGAAAASGCTTAAGTS